MMDQGTGVEGCACLGLGPGNTQGVALEGRGLIYRAGGTGLAFPVVWEAERAHLGGGGADSSKHDVLLCEGDSDKTQEA